MVHGIPGERVLKNGDIVSVDCGEHEERFLRRFSVYFCGWGSRTGGAQLLKRTKESLYLAIEMAVAGKRVGDIGSAVQEYVEPFGYSGREGTGRTWDWEDICMKSLMFRITERGEQVSNCREGMVICIEPMINLGTKNVVQESDGWTIRTADRMPSAHFELTVVVRRDKAGYPFNFPVH